MLDFEHADYLLGQQQSLKTAGGVIGAPGWEGATGEAIDNLLDRLTGHTQGSLLM